MEDPPAARGQLGRGDPHQRAGGDVAQPMAVVVEPRPSYARRQAVEANLGPRVMNLVRERRGQRERHRGVTRWHRGLPGEGSVPIGVETLLRPRPAQGQFGPFGGRTGQHERDGQSPSSLGHPLVMAHQPGHDEARADRPVHLRLTEVAHDIGDIVRPCPAIVLLEALHGTIEQHESREAADRQGTVPPVADPSCCCAASGSGRAITGTE